MLRYAVPRCGERLWLRGAAVRVEGVHTQEEGVEEMNYVQDDGEENAHGGGARRRGRARGG